MIDLKVVMKELLGLLNLTRAQAFYIYKLIEVVVVCKDNNLIFIAFQIVVPRLKGFNDSHELLVVNFIANLNKDYFLREKGY